jgi:hypothetical protein
MPLNGALSLLLLLLDTQGPSWQAAAQAAAQAAVNDAWQEALLDYQRAVASAPGVSSSSSSSSVAPQQPRVTLQDGSHLSVSVPLLPGADVEGLLLVIEAGMDALASNSTSCQQQQQSYLLSTQRVMLWDVNRWLARQQQQQRDSGPAGSSGDGAVRQQQLSVQVVLPLQQSSPHEASSGGSSNDGDSSHGQVSVVKAGPFTADELALLSKLVAAANKPGGTHGVSVVEVVLLLLKQLPDQPAL